MATALLRQTATVPKAEDDSGRAKGEHVQIPLFAPHHCYEVCAHQNQPNFSDGLAIFIHRL
jgi:hypothetical protein